MKRARMVQIAAACVGLLTATVIGGTALASHTLNQLDVCCAWNDSSLADGDLTYRVAGGDATAQGWVGTAIEQWDDALVGLTLTPTTSKAANIDVRFKRGGGVTQGLALRSFDRAGFVRSVKLTISGSAFGDPNLENTVAEIARHEAGHALGLGHANFDDLMDPTVGGASTISACDIVGVREANHWKLVDSSGTLHAPHVTHVGC